MTWSAAAFTKKYNQPGPLREAAIVHELASGNTPENMFAFQNIKLGNDTVSVMPDYVEIGTDTDSLRVPMTPYSAQWVADHVFDGHVSFPLPKLVDAIWMNADLKLDPTEENWNYVAPISGETCLRFLEHSRAIDKQINKPFTILAGQKKDVVGLPVRNCVSIYGWHRKPGKPIQSLFQRHGGYYADYSHGIRFVLDPSGKYSGRAWNQDYPADFLKLLGKP